MELGRASYPVLVVRYTSIEVAGWVESKIESDGKHGYQSGPSRLICNHQLSALYQRKLEHRRL